MRHIQPLFGPRRSPRDRRGNILVLSATALVMMLAMTAFAVDIGYIALTESQLQNASDGAALAAAIELLGGLGMGNNPSQSQVAANASAAAVAVASANPAGDMNSVYLNSTQDIAFGSRVWNSNTNAWDESWGTGPYNIVKVTAHRDRGTTANGATNTGGDRPLPLFVAPVIGGNNASLQATSIAALQPAGGFSIAAGSLETAPVMPITFDLPSWNALLNGTGNDLYAYNTSTGQVTSGSDGILEIDLYPYSNQSLTPGNRGTVCIGASNNSTATLSRQIQYGLDADDLSYYTNNTLSCNSGTLSLKGNPGLSAGIKSALQAIIGQPRAIPIFTSVAGQGNNTTYTITQFVGIRVLFVQLTGGNKTVVAQPAVVSDDSMTASQGSSTSQFLFLPPRLIQ